MLPAFAIEHVQGSADQGEIRIRGSLRLAEAAPLWTELRRLEIGAARGQTLNFEMSAVQRVDGGAMAGRKAAQVFAPDVIDVERAAGEVDAAQLGDEGFPGPDRQRA